MDIEDRNDIQREPSGKGVNGRVYMFKIRSSNALGELRLDKIALDLIELEEA